MRPVTSEDDPLLQLIEDFQDSGMEVLSNSVAIEVTP